MTQKEFDNEMQRINAEQVNEKLKYSELIDDIDKDVRHWKEQINDCFEMIHSLKNRRDEYINKIKRINIKYHEMKHQLCMDHPKETMEATV